MRKFISISAMIVLSLLAGCGQADRAAAQFSGKASEVCQDGVLYLQFTSGVSVKYNADGTVATCKK